MERLRRSVHGSREGRIHYGREQRAWASKPPDSSGKLGITVVIGSRDAGKGKAAAEKLKAEGIHAEAVQFDVTRASDYQEVYNFWIRSMAGWTF